jgi:[protein-PII] uridylyltransferase
VNAIAGTRAIDLPLVTIRQDANLGAFVFLIYAAESDPFLSTVTGAFERLNLSITDARIHTTLSGFALYSFVVLTDRAEATQMSDLLTLQINLRQLILNPNAESRPRITRISRTMKQFPIETRVRFDSTLSANTVMEVIAQDQPGLLHRVARCLWYCKVRLVSAKIGTFGERAEDMFIITDRDGNPVNDSETRDCLSGRIDDALSGTDRRQPALATSGR